MLTSPALSTVNPAIFRGIEVGPTTTLFQHFESATTFSSAEGSSSDIICRAKCGVLLH